MQRPLDTDAPQLVVGAVRDALAPLAATFFQHPSDRFDLVGVTGTNGKTTTTYMLEAIFRAAGRVPGVLGTVEVRVGDERRPAVHTTPEAPDLQRLLADMADAGVQAAAMEVSSHGLALHRVDGTRFKAAIFTNLTQDHLDFHTDLDDYFQAKRRLFTPEFTPLGVVNVDDLHGRLLAGTAGVATVTTGTAADADWRATEVAASLEGTSFRLRSPAGSRPVRLRLAGRFNVANALGALAAADAVGIDLDTAVGGLEAPGRGARPLRAGRRRPALHRAGRLRPHPRLARQRAPGGQGGHRRTGDRGLRLRRRPRPGQAAADGRDRRAAGRRGRGHLRQPPLRGPGGDRRRGRRGGRPAAPGPTGSWSRSTAGPPSGPPWPWPGRATPSCSPARATSRARSSPAAARSPSTTALVAAEELRALLGAAR